MQSCASRMCSSLLLPLLAIASSPAAHAAFVPSFQGGLATSGLQSPQLACTRRVAPGGRGLLRAADHLPTTITKLGRGGVRALATKGGPGGDGDEDGKMWIDRIFDPLVDKYAALPESEQKNIAAVYQATYFGVCIYVGILLVRAYKASLEAGSNPF